MDTYRIWKPYVCNGVQAAGLIKVSQVFPIAVLITVCTCAGVWTRSTFPLSAPGPSWSLLPALGGLHGVCPQNHFLGKSFILAVLLKTHHPQVLWWWVMGTGPRGVTLSRERGRALSAWISRQTFPAVASDRSLYWQPVSWNTICSFF